MDLSVYKNMMAVEKTHWWYRVRRALIRDIIGSLKKEKLIILDIGCGTGETLRELHSKGHQTRGIEMHEIARNYAKSKGLDVVPGQATKLPFQDASFDVVLMLDVLEHVENDHLALQEACRVLKPEGTLILFVPAFMFLWGRQDEVSQHYRRYTKRQLIQALPPSLVVKKASYFNTFLFPPIAVIRMLINILKFEEKIATENNMTSNSFINSVLYFIFNTERLFLKWINFPFGVSIMVTSRKQ